MPVTCPKCGRPLSSLRQWHYCERVDIDTLFERKEDVVLHLFDRLIEVVGQWPGVAFSGTKACVVFVTEKTFLVVRPMKRALDMHFALREAHEGEPVYKCQKYGGRWVHYIRLREESDLTRDVLKLIRQAYEG
jgi:hypothetical protein